MKVLDLQFFGTTGVFPVHNNVFQVNLSGRTLPGTFVQIKDLETFAIAIDGNIEEWNPMDQEGWKRRAVTGKSFTLDLSGKRNFGDPGNDYVAGLAMLTGQSVETYVKWVAPNGSELLIPCVINTTKNGGGDTVAIDALEFSVLSDGKPTLTSTTTWLTFVTLDGATSGKTKVSTVSPTLTGGNSYKYALNVAIPSIGASAASWGTAYTLAGEVTAVENDTFVLVEIDGTNIIKKLGYAHANVKA